MPIQMPDGSLYDPNETEKAMTTPDNKPPAATPVRTVATVAAELEQATADHAANAKATADSLLRIKALTAELKGFVFKKRAPKVSP